MSLAVRAVEDNATTARTVATLIAATATSFKLIIPFTAASKISSCL